MRSSKLVVLLAIGVVLGGPIAATPVAAQAPADGLDMRLDSVVERALAENRVVGLVLLVARDGRLVYSRAAGYADREAGRDMREDDLFRLASVTKPIVSAAALALIDRGRLGLDDPVTRWLPDFRPKLAEGGEAEITVRHLLTHTAGLTYGFAEEADHPYHRLGVSDGLDLTDLTLDEHIRRISAAPLSSPPGTKWRYSVATDVLGAVVAAAHGASLPDAVRTLVTGPLEMLDTDFHAHDPTRLVAAYADARPVPERMGALHVLRLGPGEGVRFSPRRALRADAFPSGGAGMVGSAGDVLRLLEAIRTGGAPILGPEAVAEMTRDQIDTLDGPEPGWGFGLGFAVLRDPQAAKTPQSPGTYYWGGAYGHHWFVDPARRLTVVLLTNTAFEGMSGALPRDIRNAVYASH